MTRPADWPRHRRNGGDGATAADRRSAAWRLWVAGCLALLAAIPARAEPSPLVFLGSEDLAPFVWLDGGAAQGLVVDLARAAALRAGLNVRVDASPWPVAQQRVLGGEADALLPFDPNPERDKLYDFSAPLLESSFPIFRLASRTEIFSLATLLGRRVGVEQAGLALELLRQHPSIQLVVVPQREDAFRLLAAGQVDAVVVDRWAGEYTLHQLGIEEVTAVEPPLARSTPRIAVRKGNQALLARLNQGLAGIAEDGTGQRILEKWRPKAIERRAPRRSAISGYLGHASAALLALFSVGYLGRVSSANKRLKDQRGQLEHEIHERRHAESSLQEARATLERRVAELARTADSLRAAEVRYRRLIDNLGDSYLVCDLDGRIVECNEAYCRMLGYTADELRGKSFKDLTPPQWHTMEAEVLAAQLLKYDTCAAYEKEYRRKDGTVVPVELRPYLIRDDGGHPIQTWAFVRDISERRGAKSKLNDLLRQEQVILDHISFGVMYFRHRRLVWGNRPLGEMMGCDVRDLIGHPSGAFYAFGSDEEHQRIGNDGFASLVRGETLVRDVRGRRRNGEPFWAHLSAQAIDPADPQAGLIVCVQDITDRKRAADEGPRERAGEATAPATRAWPATVSHEIRTRLHAILGLADLIERSGATPSQQQRLEEIRRAGRQLLEVVDDALNPSKSDDGRPQAAEAIGGSAATTCVPGKNGVQAPALTLVGTGRAPASPDEAECRRVAAGRRVLLVEDEPINREVAASLLEELGLAVDCAEDGAVAVRMAAERDFDLILMDLQMPHMDGLEATWQIRQSPNGAKVPIVALTANAHSDARRACLAAGMNDFLTKPIDLKKLYAVLVAQLQPKGAKPDSG